jgi:hypothetical protein
MSIAAEGANELVAFRHEAGRIRTDRFGPTGG